MRLEEKFASTIKMIMNECIVQARCKINLHLEVKDRRSDGYHNLESIFLPLEWGDILYFNVLDQLSICDLQMVWNIPHRKYIETSGDIPLEKNLVYKAVSLFRKRTGWDKGIRIVLEKKVPVGAGLGGGSSDAAVTLCTLDALSGTRLSFGDLCEMAAELGSDVPFFLYNTPAYVSGKGDHIRKIACPWNFWVLLAIPDFESKTVSAFHILDKEREYDGEFSYISERKSSLTEKDLIDGLMVHPSKWRYYYNDFLPSFLRGEHKREYSAIFKTIENGKADFFSLSGSGSSCFGIFSYKQSAEYTGKLLADDKNFVQIIQFTSCIF
ncbi:MAG: 4-(cytidine 5'-diphospho)-2-C-methyl-D-erythritol kinase [Treponema sp.]|jgi:4-diphosphocytidyl-2-C-methyl-D-erythritol kinase|nr:4-(cytidine 5'-diphospho)-2-C-methyl-D-erythritol kinase [Treponema sp.]